VRHLGKNRELGTPPNLRPRRQWGFGGVLYSSPWSAPRFCSHVDTLCKRAQMVAAVAAIYFCSLGRAARANARSVSGHHGIGLLHQRHRALSRPHAPGRAARGVRLCARQRGAHL